MSHFNQLTPAEAERLALLVEECGEVVMVAAAILDDEGFGREDKYRAMLEKEIGDVVLIVRMMAKAGDVTWNLSSVEPRLSPHYPAPFNAAVFSTIAFLIKLCGQTSQDIGKILRHGYASRHPGGGPDNRESLGDSLKKLFTVIDHLCGVGDLSAPSIRKRVEEKTGKIVQYLHHQEVA